MGELVQFPVAPHNEKEDAYDRLARELQREPSKVRVVKKGKTVEARCMFCHHEWPLEVTLINTGLWVTQCPACQAFQPAVWHREMFGK